MLSNRLNTPNAPVFRYSSLNALSLHIRGLFETILHNFVFNFLYKIDRHSQLHENMKHRFYSKKMFLKTKYCAKLKYIHTNS